MHRSTECVCTRSAPRAGERCVDLNLPCARECRRGRWGQVLGKPGKLREGKRFVETFFAVARCTRCAGPRGRKEAGDSRSSLWNHWFGCPFLSRCGARRGCEKIGTGTFATARSVDSGPSCSAVRRTHGSPPQDWPRATQRPVASNSASVCGWPASLHQPSRSNSCGTRHPKT
jgi:hypothetical protein